VSRDHASFKVCINRPLSLSLKGFVLGECWFCLHVLCLMEEVASGCLGLFLPVCFRERMFPCFLGAFFRHAFFSGPFSPPPFCHTFFDEFTIGRSPPPCLIGQVGLPELFPCVHHVPLAYEHLAQVSFLRRSLYSPIDLPLTAADLGLLRSLNALHPPSLSSLFFFFPFLVVFFLENAFKLMSEPSFLGSQRSPRVNRPLPSSCPGFPRGR